MLTIGQRLAAPNGGAEFIVTRADQPDAVVQCDGADLVALDQRPDPGRSGEPGPAFLIGKRYEDDAAELELLCTKPGVGRLTVDGRELTLRTAKPLPATD